MRVVIVDDHVLFREGLAAIIRQEHDIEIAGLAGSVKEAVELVGKAKPDLVLMDFNLTDGTGADATRQILAKDASCKIVFLTMYDDDESLLEAVRAGAKGYLLKNMHPSKLAPTLRAVYAGESALSRAMTLRLMEEFSQAPVRRRTEESPVSILTDREIDILRSVGMGKSNEEIAQEKYLSVNTVKYHVHSILSKLGLEDRKMAAEYARKHQLIK